MNSNGSIGTAQLGPLDWASSKLGLKDIGQGGTDNEKSITDNTQKKSPAPVHGGWACKLVLREPMFSH